MRRLALVRRNAANHRDPFTTRTHAHRQDHALDLAEVNGERVMIAEERNIFGTLPNFATLPHRHHRRHPRAQVSPASSRVARLAGPTTPCGRWLLCTG
jgi:hypothetical protein